MAFVFLWIILLLQATTRQHVQITATPDTFLVRSGKSALFHLFMHTKFIENSRYECLVRMALQC